MPRKARIDLAGAVQHLIIRGIERKKIFRDDSDRDDFLERLGKLLVESRTPCYAFALLSNHAHLLVRTGSVPIATLMRRLLTGYAVTFNHRHRRHGQLFQNRYKSILCQEDSYLLELVRYIHLKPLRAKAVADYAELERYRYAGTVFFWGIRRTSGRIVITFCAFLAGECDPRGQSTRSTYERGLVEGVGQNWLGAVSCGAWGGGTRQRS